MRKVKRILTAILCPILALTLISPVNAAYNPAYNPDIPEYYRDPTDHIATPLHEGWLDNAWSMVGMGGGGSVYNPTWSPLDPDLVMLRSDMGGAFISYDAAYTWSMLDFNNVADAFVYDLYDENVIYAGGPGGLFKTVDKGQKWTRILPHEDRSVLQFRGNHADPYYVSPEWANYDYTGQTGIAAELGLAPDRYPNAPPPDDYPYQGRVAGIAIDPQNSDNIYAAVHQAVGQNAGFLARDFLFFSDNGGAGFTLVKADITTKANNLTSGSIQASPTVVDDFVGLFVDVNSDPADRDVFFVSTGGVHKITTSTGEAVKITNRTFGYSGEEYPHPDFLYDEDTGVCTYYLISNGASSNSDGAGYLVKTTDMIDFTQISATRFRGFSIANNDVIYANGVGGTAGANVSTIYKTTDGGGAWTVVFDPRTQSNNPDKFGKSWMEVAYGTNNNGWSRYGQTRGIGASKANPDNVAATTDGIIFGTRDGGVYWEQMYSKVHDNGDGTLTYSTNGGNWTTSYGVHFDPFDPLHVFLTMTDVGLFQSHDGGQTWIQSDRNINTNWRNTCYWLAFDPELEGVIYSVWSNHHDYPQLIMLPPRQTESAMSGRTVGFAASYDGGLTWGYQSTSSSGLPNSSGSMTHIVVDPNSPADARVLYIASMWRGVYKSSDGGRTWALRNTGIDALAGVWNQTIAANGFVNFTSEVRPIYKLAIAANGWLYATFARYGAEFIGESHGAIYVSKDQAETWEKLPMPGTNVNFINGFACDPNDADVIYAAAWQSTTGQPCLLSETNPLRETPRYNSGGIYKSVDGGLSWTLKWGADRNVYGLQIDPYNSNNVFAVTFNSELMATEDAGETWRQVRGYDFKQSHSPFIDPNHPDFVFVTSYGGNIWRGPSGVQPKLGSLAVNGVGVDVDPDVHSYAVTVDKDVGVAEITAAGVYHTAAVDVAGAPELAHGDNIFEITVTNELGAVSEAYTLNVVRGAATAAKASVSAPSDTADVKLPVEFDVSLSGENVITVELEFTVDSDLLEMAYTEASAGFAIMDGGAGGIKWTFVGDGKVKGEMTLVCQSPGDSLGFTSEELAEILKLFFTAKAPCLAAIELTGFKAYGPEDAGGAVKELNADIVDASAETSVIIVYSPYDLNKDGVVDARDLSIAALYCQFNSQDSGWDTFVKTVDSFGAGITASMCDFNGDGEVNMLDLVELYLNYMN